MTGSLEVSIAAWSQYIILKLFWKTLENNVIKGPLFHTYPWALYKKLVILVFWYKYSLFVPIFIATDWKRDQI